MAVMKRWIELEPTFFDSKPPGRPTIGKPRELILMVAHCTKIKKKNARAYTTRHLGTITISARTKRECVEEVRRFINRRDVVLLECETNAGTFAAGLGTASSRFSRAR